MFSTIIYTIIALKSHGHRHCCQVKWCPHPAELMRPGVNFGVPVGWGFVLFVTSQSKHERVVNSSWGLPSGCQEVSVVSHLSGALCDVTVIIVQASSNFANTRGSK